MSEGNGDGLQACQFDSFARKLTATIIECNKVPPPTKTKGKKPATQVATHLVRLSDTVLFCEGGGQPADHGTINNVAVIDVQRDGSGLVWHHATACPGEPGDTMTCHTGQHLISALADQRGWHTEGWRLTRFPETCTINLRASRAEDPLTGDGLRALESQCNAAILQALPIQVSVVDHDPVPEEVAASPDGAKDASFVHRKDASRHHGQLRIVSIGSGDHALDRNPCCGTHLATLAQLTAVCFFGGFDVDPRTEATIEFRCGSRLLAWMHDAATQEQELRAIVCSSDVVARVQQIHDGLRTSTRYGKRMAERYAKVLGQQLGAQVDKSGGCLFHWEEDGASMSFLNSVVQHVEECQGGCGDMPFACLVAGQQAPGSVVFLLVAVSPPAKFDVSVVGAAVASAFHGKGGGRRGRFQGKGTHASGWNDAKEAFQRAWHSVTGKAE